MTLDVSIQGMRRAAAIGVSAMCREAGRTLFYRWQQRLSSLRRGWTASRRLHARPGPARNRRQRSVMHRGEPGASDLRPA
jgi:hypothetical protein